MNSPAQQWLAADQLTKPWNVATPQPKSMAMVAENEQVFQMNKKRERALLKIKGPSRIPANTKNWSEESQRAQRPGHAPAEYKNYTKKCIACRNVFGVSASDQKKWYERWKVYIGRGPVRCLSLIHI